MWLPLGPEESFDLLGDVQKLDRLTPSWFQLVPVGTVSNQQLAVGSRIQYRLRWRGWRTDWQSVIQVWKRPSEIVYEQERGLFKSFRHEHYFIPQRDGTRVIDRLIFDAPGGQLARRWLVEPDLRKILEFRRRSVGGRPVDHKP